MATQTQKFGFTKPEPNEFYSVDVQNENWDKADELFAKVTYGTEDLVEGESELTTGTLYFVYE